MGKLLVVGGVDYPVAAVKIEGGVRGVSGRKRSFSTSGPPLNDQGTILTVIYINSTCVCVCIFSK